MTPESTATQLEMARNVHDLGSINSMREAMASGDPEVLKEAAQQFEGIFVQMMLKSMRKAQDALADENSPFNSQQMQFYRDMHDQQLATDLSSNGGLGLADIIMQQLGPGTDDSFTPASVLRNNANLSMSERQAVQQSQQAVLNTTPVLPSAYKDVAFDSPETFVKTLYPHAQRAAEKLGVQPEAIIAQAALETGWGKHVIHDGKGQSSHNLFGVKANSSWEGQQAVVDTIEFDGSVASKQKAAFRKYDSIGEAVDDYVKFIQEQPRYGKAVENSQNTEAYFRELQDAGYATDPQYANKVLSVLDGDMLRRYLP